MTLNTTSTSKMLEPGAILQDGRYIIDKVLGHGGMGAVYQARHSMLGAKRVAIKEMFNTATHEADHDRAIENFMREAQMLANLDHPGLVDVSDFFEEEDKHYLVMQYIEGRSLDQELSAHRDWLPIPILLQWADAICDVLAYLHSLTPPVILRDLKPGKVMLDKKGKIWIIDFGIAKDNMTDRTATFIRGAGTPGYAPVEQYGGAPTDHRSDIYALGATLYTLATRTVPPPSVALLSRDATLNPPRAINPAIPVALEGVILKMMALHREERFQTVEEVRHALKAIPAAEQPTSMLSAPPAPPCEPLAVPTRSRWSMTHLSEGNPETRSGRLKSEDTVVREAPRCGASRAWMAIAVVLALVVGLEVLGLRLMERQGTAAGRYRMTLGHAEAAEVEAACKALGLKTSVSPDWEPTSKFWAGLSASDAHVADGVRRNLQKFGVPAGVQVVEDRHVVHLPKEYKTTDEAERAIKDVARRLSESVRLEVMLAVRIKHGPMVVMLVSVRTADELRGLRSLAQARSLLLQEVKTR